MQLLPCVDFHKVHEAIERLNAGQNHGDIGAYSNRLPLGNDTFIKTYF